MLKAFNLRFGLRNQRILAAKSIECNYSTKRGKQGNKKGDTTTADNVPVEPLQLSYNSYEDLSSDPEVSPVIIMHGL